MMGQSLATSAVSGGSKSYSLSAEALEALKSGDTEALIASHRQRFGGFRMEKDDDVDDQDDSDKDESEEDDDEDDDSDEDDDEDDKDDKAKAKSKESKRVKELSDENARHRNRNKQLRKELDEMKAELKKVTDKDKPEDAKSKERLTELEADNSKLATTVRDLAIQNAFLQSNEYKWKSPKAALRLADLDDVEIDDDGEVTGLKEALKKLAKEEPYLLDTGKDSDDDEDEEDERPPAGQPTRRKKGKGNPNRDKLLQKYPALRR